MDFFTAQDNARRKTGQLVVLLIAAVIALIAVTTVVIAIVVHFMRDDRGSVTANNLLAALSPELVAVVALGVVALVGLGGLFKRSQLRRGGGKVVAEALGGREISPSTENANERRILNVVEEMAIASGTPVPPVYLLQEAGINAFAAGYDTSDAVIGITQGAINHLNREELQGVVAHEFSHILHGDMRLNMRLISVLHGVLLIGLLGYILLRSTATRGRAVRRNNSNGKGAVVVLALGVALAVIGYAGTFFGNWIKAAVSRQREYLADASAVQYTRNPNGIGQALIKIGSLTQGARIEASQASEYSHLFFGQGMKLGFTRLLATHPPIRQRIKRVMPSWNGEFNAPLSAPFDGDMEKAGGESVVGFADTPSAHAYSSAATMNGTSARMAIASMGQPGPRHLAQARTMLNALPTRLVDAAHDPYAVRALMYALLLSQNIEVRKQQLASLQQTALPDVYREVMNHAGDVLMLRDQLRLPLMELALPALKNLSVDQATHFRHCMVELINADSQVSLFEWTLYHWLVHHLGLGKKDSGPAVRKLSDLQQECQRLLNVLAWAGQSDPEKVSAALDAAEKELPFALSAKREAPDIKALGPAVSRLRRLRPQQKPAVLQAMARCIEHSGQIKPAEAELFRVIADMLECPMPPLLIESD